MFNQLKEVYIKDKCHEDLIEINPEYVYITIPADYICIYHQLLILFADYGREMLDDCNASCKDKNKNITNCFNMFNAAVAARHLGNVKLAATLIKYVKNQLKLDYNRTNIPCPGAIYPITKDGKLKALVSCQDNPKFYVDSETGKLIQCACDDNNEYIIEDDDLKVTDK